jgi:hypothetical protein
MTNGAAPDGTFQYYLDRWRLMPEGDRIPHQPILVGEMAGRRLY